MKIEYQYTEQVLRPSYKYEGGYGIFDAVYTPAISKMHSGNPFIEALPEPLSEQEIINHYYTPCPIMPDITAGIEQQLSEVNFLRDVRIPLPFSIVLERQFTSAIQETYRRREETMFSIPRKIVTMDQEDMQSMSFRNVLGGDTGIGVSLLGVGGCGKSESIKKLLRRYPQVIRHNWEIGEFKQIVWLFVVTPPNANLNDLFVAIGRAIDEALGNSMSYYENLVSHNKSVGLKSMCITTLIKELHIGAIVLDEIQNIANARIRDDSVNAIVQIINNTKVALVVIGTEDAYKGLFRQYYVQRRTGAMIVANDYCRDKEYFGKVLKHITKVNWFHETFELTEDLMEALYRNTRAVIDRVVTLWIDIQNDYITAKTKPEITPAYIDKIADEKRPLMGFYSALALEESPLHNDAAVSQGDEEQDCQLDFRGNMVQENIMEPLKTCKQPFKALDVFQVVRENINLSGRYFNQTTIVKIVTQILNRKANAELDVLELSSKVIQKLNKMTSDKRSDCKDRLLS